MIGSGTLGALMMAFAGLIPPAPMNTGFLSAKLPTLVRRKKAQKSLKKSGRAPVSIAERELIDAAEAKRERKAAKYARDMQRMKKGAFN